MQAIRQLWTEESGQDVAEYAVMLAVILVIVIGTVRLIGTNANTVFSQVGSQMAHSRTTTAPLLTGEGLPLIFLLISPAYRRPCAMIEA